MRVADALGRLDAFAIGALGLVRLSEQLVRLPTLKVGVAVVRINVGHPDEVLDGAVERLEFLELHPNAVEQERVARLLCEHLLKLAELVARGCVHFAEVHSTTFAKRRPRRSTSGRLTSTAPCPSATFCPSTLTAPSLIFRFASLFDDASPV